jgi:L-fuconolactonase
MSEAPPEPIIDAHQHFWRIGEHDCVWPHSGLRDIHRDFEAVELKTLAGAVGVRGSVLVQSQPSDRDTDYLLALAAEEPFVQAVVGWVDLASPTAPARIAELASHPKFRGVRPMLQALAQDSWILDPSLQPALSAMVEHGLSLDALVQPRHLPHLLAFAERHPELPMVIDHAAKPAIGRGEIAGWREGLQSLAALPHVHCKLSGLLTECAPGQGVEHLRPYVDHLLEMFGCERLMWGSDWPVLNLSGDYAGWLAMAQDLVRGSGDKAVAWVFARSARGFYRF